MSVSWFIAKRYLQSQRRSRFLSFITIFSIAGITLGTAALILALSILDGFEREIKEKVVSFTSHIEVQGYSNQPLDEHRRSMVDITKNGVGVLAMSPFAAREGMIRSRGGVDGVYLKGIDTQLDVLLDRRHIVEGRSIRAGMSGVHELLIGRKLAMKLDVQVGGNAVVFALQRGENTRPRAMQFEVVGIYESGMAEFDDIYAYCSLSDAQDLLQIGDRVTGFDILVGDINQVHGIAAVIQERLGYPHYVRTVFQMYHNLFAWVELQKKLSPVLLSLIIIVAMINIVGTLLMFVLEKTRAIGILKSLGAGPAVIRRIFVVQGALIGLVGIMLGNLLAYAVCALQLRFRIITLPAEVYYMDTAPILLRPENFLAVSAIAFILCLGATFLPARAAVSVNPVNALRFG